MKTKLSTNEASEKLKAVSSLNDPFLLKCLEDERKGIVNLALKKKHALEKDQAAREKFYEMSVYEEKLRKQGFSMIAGIDEVGRGPLAGPVVAAAVILPEGFFLKGLNDSKQIPKNKLEVFADYIKNEAAAIGIGIVDAAEIDQINIYQAAKKAMNIGIADLGTTPDYLLVDAMKLSAPFPQEAIIKGDSSSISIAAASIIAKVTRDRMMTEFGVQYPEYRFEKNAGYGTPEHLAALKEFGPTPLHRKSFAPVKTYL
ncbi:ribonuclease HII [Peribacillus deserti]|uniref:Ribonuclease HII n=1 Tax=Peribacillus deserti TaxID=673318 RepID=A0A2N5M6V9_9BACI|nr:ribonuclease HII [Peribacillus deserti]PLT30081.1 ribonuclease HII [Peribacillus deserti]